MKKILFLLSLVFVFAVTVEAQRGSGTVLMQKFSALTLNGTGGDTIDLPPIMGEYDVSLQLWPALSGAGDSLIFSYIYYYSNSLADAVWTAGSTADTVGNTATDSDGLVTWTDFKELRLRIICTGISADTCTVTPYVVYKKHSSE